MLTFSYTIPLIWLTAKLCKYSCSRIKRVKQWRLSLGNRAWFSQLRPIIKAALTMLLLSLIISRLMQRLKGFPASLSCLFSQTMILFSFLYIYQTLTSNKLTFVYPPASLIAICEKFLVQYRQYRQLTNCDHKSSLLMPAQFFTNNGLLSTCVHSFEVI